jgi:hypothetical protein
MHQRTCSVSSMQSLAASCRRAFRALSSWVVQASSLAPRASSATNPRGSGPAAIRGHLCW